MPSSITASDLDPTLMLRMAAKIDLHRKRDYYVEYLARRVEPLASDLANLISALAFDRLQTR